MHVLVTGATGFIGRHLIDRLFQENFRIRALVHPEEERTFPEMAGIEIIHGDICDYPSLERAARHCQLIYHLAGKTEANTSSTQSFEEVNVQGTANVARAALHAGVQRLVFSSSGALYGRTITNRDITESTLPTPDSPYGQSKFLAERMLLSHHQCDGLPVVVARLSAVFGPGALNWLNLFQTIASGEFRLLGDGRNYHHTADVSDIVEGLALCGSIKEIEGRIYLLAGSEPVQLVELIHYICEEIGISHPPKTLPAWPFRLYQIASRYVYAMIHCRLPRADRIDLYFGDRKFNLSRSRQELGYSPKVKIREAVARTTEWFKQYGFLTGFSSMKKQDVRQ
jgi:nucleoside-diphosphate-sugar epimerase